MGRVVFDRHRQHASSSFIFPRYLVPEFLPHIPVVLLVQAVYLGTLSLEKHRQPAVASLSCTQSQESRVAVEPPGLNVSAATPPLNFLGVKPLAARVPSPL